METALKSGHCERNEAISFLQAIDCPDHSPLAIMRTDFLRQPFIFDE